MYIDQLAGFPLEMDLDSDKEVDSEEVGELELEVAGELWWLMFCGGGVCVNLGNPSLGKGW